MIAAIRLVWQSGKGLVFAGLALMIMQGVLPLLTLYLTKLVVDAITAEPLTNAFGRVLVLLGIATGVAIANNVCTESACVVREAQSQALTDHTHDLIHAKSAEIDLEYYDNSQYYDTLHRARFLDP